MAAVIGDFILLDSDIDKEYAQIQAAGGSVKDFTRCELLENFWKINYTHIMPYKIVL